VGPASTIPGPVGPSATPARHRPYRAQRARWRHRRDRSYRARSTVPAPWGRGSDRCGGCRLDGAGAAGRSGAGRRQRPRALPGPRRDRRHRHRRVEFVMRPVVATITPQPQRFQGGMFPHR
jgi:hypothetical protein